MKYMSEYRDWLLSDYFDEETKRELEDIEGDEKEIEDRFYKNLDFGTGGMRGKIGAGTNRMNKYTVRKATQGLANYIINYSDDGRDKGVVIAYDSRHKSPEFALEAALVLNGNGINTYLFDELRPTPELSFAVRELEAVAGIVITASHNPPEYNGYKVYGEDGGQVVPDKARKIIAEIEEITDFSLINRMSREEAGEEGLFRVIGEEIDKRYNEEMLQVIPDRELCRKKGKEIGIIYTPLHGTANKPVRRLLSALGFRNVDIVEEQATPDPDFSTVESPNPEDPASFTMALEMAREQEPELLIATDPDGDRMGIIVRDDRGRYKNLNGNQIGVLMADYLLHKRDVTPDSVIIKTIVTTEMVRKMTDEFGIEVIDVLTGFKYIGEKIEQFTSGGKKKFILGFEESYGYLTGTYARDKDAVVASGLVAAMCLHYRNKGSSLYERLQELRDKYGYYLEDLESIRLEGKEGQEIIAKTLATLREERPEEIAGRQITAFKDYKEGVSYLFTEHTEEEIDLPESNVLQYFLDDESLLTVRPSGTEPKLKIYFAVCGEGKYKAENILRDLKDKFLSRIREIIAEF